MKTLDKLNRLERLTVQEKARILHQLFPAEIPMIVYFILKSCREIQQKPISTDENDVKQVQDAEEVKGYIDFYKTAIMKSSHVFANELFHPNRAEFVTQCLKAYRDIRSRNSNKLPLAIGLLFDEIVGLSFMMTDNDYNKPEYILHAEESEDTWICLCGNMAEDEGFYACDENGNEVEPVESEWDNLYVCMGCGRFFNADDMKIIGHNPNPHPLDLGEDETNN